MAGELQALRVHRRGGYSTYGWLFGLFAVIGLLVALFSGGLSSGQRAATMLCCVAVLMASYVFGVRPVVAEEPEQVVVRNPLRTIEVPWAAIDLVDMSDVLRLHAGSEVVRCYAVPLTRARNPVRRRTGGLALFGPSLASADLDFGPPAKVPDQRVEERLTEMAARLGSGRPPGAVVRRWDVLACVCVAAAPVLIVAAVVLW